MSASCNCFDDLIQCPICPLVKANVRLCDTLVKWNGKQKEHGFGFALHADPGVLDAYNTPILRDAIQLLIMTTFLAFDLVKKQKIGDSADFEQTSHEFYFKRLTKRAWRFCFHTKIEEKEEEDPC